MNRKDEITQHLSATLERIRTAERDAGREPESVELLPVTKFHPVTDVEILYDLGIRAVGENREQEARAKVEEFPAMRYHMIGQIQTKKANAVARWASQCHSVDSIRLAQALDHGVSLARERGQRNMVLPCYIQWSADGNSARGGVETAGIDDLAQAIVDADNLKLAGLMVVPPLGADALKVFQRARELTDALGKGMRLSAGMSADLEAAIHAGTDLVRVGTEILGSRPLA